MVLRKNGSVPNVPLSDDDDSAAAIKAFQEVAASDPVNNALSGKTVWNQPDAEYLTAAMNRPGGWMYGPAMFQFFAAAVIALQKLGFRSLGTNTVDKVRACLIDGTKHVYIVPTDADDRSGIQVNRYSDQTWINLVKLLAPAGLRVKSGYRERYELSLVEESPVGPALFLDMGRMQERRRIKRNTKKKSTETKAKPE